jgi:hypothetical protein
MEPTNSGIRSEEMADIQRISAQQAHAKTKANQALLFCAYEDEAKCKMLNLDLKGQCKTGHAGSLQNRP